MPESADRCFCPVGYYGLYCEAYQEAIPVSNLFQVKNPPLVHFVNTEIALIYNVWPSYLAAVQNDPAFVNNIYGSYYLYGYNEEKPDQNYGFDGPKDKEAFLSTFGGSGFLRNTTGPNICGTRTLFTSLLGFIKKNKFSQTSINLFTMYPSDDKSYVELEEIAIAFKLRVCSSLNKI